MLTPQRQEQVLALCSSLVQCQSYSGQESGVAKLLCDFMTAHGFDSVTTDHYGNVIGCIKGNRPGKKTPL